MAEGKETSFKTLVLIFIIGSCVGGIAASCGIMASVFLLQGLHAYPLNAH